MLTNVPTPPKHLGDYAPVIGVEPVEALRAAAEPFRGARVLQLSSTAFGGGVAELLYTIVPMMNDLGIHTEWKIISGDEPFFSVTKAMHNGLQGMEVPFTKEMRAHYMTITESNAEAFEGDWDFVVVHDPQPAAILPELNEDYGPPKGRWIWRCHIDLTKPFEPVWKFLAPMVAEYHATVFTMQEFVPPGIEDVECAIIQPSIDPLAVKNIPLDDSMVREVMKRYGLDPKRPLIVQVSRFDPWKDPMGVIDAYRTVKEKIPEVQLALVGSMAHDDPEGWDYYSQAIEHRNEDPDIFLLSNVQDVGNLAVNAFQRAANVVVQKSLREGFGLTVSEGMWKNKPVIGGKVGGITTQIVDGQTGFLVDSVDECAQRLLELIADPKRAQQMGRAGRKRVKERFLSTRQVMEELALFERIKT